MTPLIDRFGRVHRSLRISVTDRCNIRCQYCMPDVAVKFLPKSRLLSYEEITEFCRCIASSGVTRIRLTGGEPLVRGELYKLIAMLKETVPTIESIAITTNGMLLAAQIEALKAAGLEQINVSLDTLRDEVFQRLSRREGLDRVLEGIDAAIAHGYRPRLNAVLLRQLNLEDAVPLVEYAVERGLVMRFIEFMPLDSERQWNGTQMISGESLRSMLEQRFGPLERVEREDPSRPSNDFQFKNFEGRVGFIDSVSAPFCSDCDRLRLTADGKLRNCLFGNEEWDVAAVLRSGSPPIELAKLIQDCVASKFAAHGIGQPEFVPPQRAMYQIGG